MSLTDLMAVQLPEMEQDGLAVRRLCIIPDDPRHLQHLKWGRAANPGTYTALYLNKQLWMSDTTAERRDHLPVVEAIRDLKARRIIVNGLGLGMIVQAALQFDHVDHIDVVESDERVINLIGPFYTESGRVRIHHADAYVQTKKWPKSTRWDVGWSDIWPNICEDNLPQMAILNRSYGRRCAWHKCWGQDFLRDIRHRSMRNNVW